jgi:beta-1,4-N-acetylglucosaminyltransferase
MIFLTVGTQFPFDRLVKSVDLACDAGLIDEEIVAQIGESLYKPRNFRAMASLDKDLFDRFLKEASGIISHAGIGTITMALDNKKPLLVMPRLAKYGEVVNDHQTAIARKFSELGYILAAYDSKDFADEIRKLKSFVPRERKVDPKPVADRICHFLNSYRTKSG